MVLFKRKPVQYVARPVALYESQDIWLITETDEIFTNYDDYIARMDYYKQKRFICEVTGHSGLDFFDALRNETEASHEVDSEFPEALRGPILRKVQHSTISRIDMLVDYVYDAFKHPEDIVEGERVVCTVDDPGWGKLTGEVREKVEMPGPYGHKTWRFFVSLDNMPDKEAMVDCLHIWRERKAFTKMVLRSFLKSSLHREAWNGAPWQVKDHLAKTYRIDTRIPPHLTYEYHVAQRKLTLNHKRGGTILNFFPHAAAGLPDIKPKGWKKQLAMQTEEEREQQFQEYQRALSRNPDLAAYGRTLPNGDSHAVPFISQGIPGVAAAKAAAARQTQPPPPPPIKYPREDLENPPSDTVRPALKFLGDIAPTAVQVSDDDGGDIRVGSVGLLLETWDTLNVYCEVFLLDSFTFDDYVEALQTYSESVQPELLVEIHCAILKRLVNGEKDQNGSVQINLPDEESGDESSSASSSSASEPASPEPEVQTRTTRGSLAKSEAAELKAQAALDAKKHQALEVDQCVKNYGWKARLRKRDFANGRWIVIVVGLLGLYASVPRHKALCDAVLAQLAPIGMDATEKTVIGQYAGLDVNLRVQILQFLCLLTLDTRAIRDYMEDCTTSMTQFRKEKIEWQRKRKALIDELKSYEEERRALQPDKLTPVTEVEDVEAEPDVKMTEPEEEPESAQESLDEDAAPPRKLRRANDRAAERKRRQDEERKRKDKAESDKAKKSTKEARQLEKLLKKIEDAKDQIRECEAEVETCDNDLRESDCPRTRVLGKDRFWNRYYWFERNAMPYAGLPDSSTAHAGYANACVWVQGPDDAEREGFIELAEAENAQYRAHYGVTVPQRKLREEGGTHTFTARQWGFLDDPAALDRLIAWLSDRGSREAKLRKELLAQREHIATHMEHRRAYLSGERRAAADEPAAPVGRHATRGAKAPARPSLPDPDNAPRCLAWHNTTALRELGHLHSEPPRGPRKGVARPVNNKRAAAAAAAAAVEDEGRQTRASNRQGRPLGRRGTRYNF